MQEEKPLLVSFLVCLFYGATSGSLAMIMKSLLSGFKFEGYFLLLAAQYGLQLAICVFTRDHMRGNPLSVPTYDRAVHMRSLWMGVLGVVNVGAGLVALRMVNVPMFLCIRRLVSSFILGYEFAVLGRVPTTGVLLAVCGILVGTLLAGWETLSANVVGYAVTLLNNVLSAAVRAPRRSTIEYRPRLNRTPSPRTPSPPPLPPPMPSLPPVLGRHEAV